MTWGTSVRVGALGLGVTAEVKCMKLEKGVRAVEDLGFRVTMLSSGRTQVNTGSATFFLSTRSRKLGT